MNANKGSWEEVIKSINSFMGGDIKPSAEELAGLDSKKGMGWIPVIAFKCSVPNVFIPLASPQLHFVQFNGHLDIFLEPDVKKALHFSNSSHDNIHLDI